MVTKIQQPKAPVWTEDELIISIYLYRFGWEDLGVPYTLLGQMMGRKPSTIVFRMANFLSFDGIKSGLRNGGKHAQEVYDHYRVFSRDALRAKAVQALLNLSTGKAGEYGAEHP